MNLVIAEKYAAAQHFVISQCEISCEIVKFAKVSLSAIAAGNAVLVRDLGVLNELCDSHRQARTARVVLRTWLR